MALITCHVFAESLRQSTAFTVLLPQPAAGQIGLAGVAGDDPPPVLYLLHGLSYDETIWLRRTSIERYAAERGLAVVMPRAGRSFYLDEAHGEAYWTFLSQELPSLVGRFFRVSERRADTFVAGLSMGGYGAFRWALREPHRLAAAASLSGVLDLAGVLDQGLRQEVPHAFGDRPVAGTDDDLFALLERADPARLPALYLACGTEDDLLPGNRAFVERAQRGTVPLTVDLRPGSHDWAFWDTEIQHVLAWLPLRAE